jgi:hypothetical protein
MTKLFVPPIVAHELRQRTRSFREDVLRSVYLGDDDLYLREYNQALRRIDQRLLLVLALEHVVPGVPMKPGYYHLMVDNGLSVPLTVTVIEGEHGEFAVPTSRIFEKLQAGDMRERRNLERFAAVERERHAAVEREKARDREERRDHRRDLVNAYTRTSVAGPGAGPWAQNQAGRRDVGERRRAI